MPYLSLILGRPKKLRSLATTQLIDTMSARWNKQLLDEVFLPFDVKVIMGIPLCTMNTPDFWSWMFEKKCHFSVKSAYNMLVATRQRREAWLEGSAAASGTNTEEGSWKALWKTQVPGKLRLFLWRLSKQSLPTEDVCKGASPHVSHEFLRFLWLA